MNETKKPSERIEELANEIKNHFDGDNRNLWVLTAEC